MAYIKETVNHPTIGEDDEVQIEVLQKHHEQYWEPWKIINLNVDSFIRLTPDELISMGEWFVKEGRRIKTQYNKNGDPK